VEKLAAYGADRPFQNMIKSYMCERRQLVDYDGCASRKVALKAGSPQGSVLSPLLFLVMIADAEEWISEACIITYADDNSIYAWASTKWEVRQILEKAAEEFLAFTRASKLSANPEKTMYVMFGRQEEEPIRIGQVYVKESKEATLLGMTFTKSLTWKKHWEQLRNELTKRVGILHRLKSHLPRSVLVNMIEPLFTAKLRFGLELLVNTVEGPSGSQVVQLARLQRRALRAALGDRSSRGASMEQLLEDTGQKSIFQMALVATCWHAWKCGQDWQGHPLTEGRIRTHLNIRHTRQSSLREHPPQSVPDSFIHRMVEVWEQMPVDIKNNKNPCHVKKKIRAWVQSRTY